MRRRLKALLQKSSLAVKIRFFYLLMLVPVIAYMIFCIYTAQGVNRKTEAMIDSVSLASEFSLDFKKDFDYETYLVIVGNKTMEESRLGDLLTDALRVVDGLGEYTTSEENSNRLIYARRYLENLATYKSRIAANLEEGNKYEDNILIWENDVQIVTSLVQETIFEYIFYETAEIQQVRVENRTFYSRMISFSLAFLAAIVVMILLFSYYIPLTITRPIRQLVQVTDQVAKGDLSVRSETYEDEDVGVLADSLNTMIDKINELVSQITQEQINLREAELELLQSQINPHFLYNTLDTIVWLAEGGHEKEVVQMVKSLSAFFRTSISRGDDIILLREELVHARSYLEIQQFRYQDILEYEIDVPESLEEFYIPKITIQPLVENALYHGIKNKRGKGTISIKAKQCGDDFVILVVDNGIGMTQDRLEEVQLGLSGNRPSETKIYGLYNVNERIRLKFGDRYGIRLTSTYGEGTETEIRLPCRLTREG